ncbi:MAG TPA: hypothetical protein VLQ48_04040 [Chloroflexia bacterium]|nr:hypothetical protein [Chloroflexia bacterium]
MIDTPNPRLPLEPEEYPLYAPPKRVGCSALAILPIILIAIFVFLFFRVTPNMAQGMVNPVRQIFGIELPTEVPAAGVISSSGALATQTASVITPTATLAPPTSVPPTPTTIAEEYVKVANTQGQGVRLRAEPKLDAARVDGLGEGVVCKIIGPDQKNEDGTWRNVTVVSGGGTPGETGWILSNWLVAAPKP